MEITVSKFERLTISIIEMIIYFFRTCCAVNQQTLFCYIKIRTKKIGKSVENQSEKTKKWAKNIDDFFWSKSRKILRIRQTATPDGYFRHSVSPRLPLDPMPGPAALAGRPRGEYRGWRGRWRAGIGNRWPNLHGISRELGSPASAKGTVNSVNIGWNDQTRIRRFPTSPERLTSKIPLSHTFLKQPKKINRE